MNRELADPVAAGGLPRRVAAVRLAEFLVLFFIGPALGTLLFHPRHVLVVLVPLVVGALILLLRDPEFDRSELGNWGAARAEIPAMLRRFAVLMPGVIALVLIFIPERFFSFPRERPALWALVMVFYPFFSVYPQEVVWRVFVHNRYRALFTTRAAMVTASALAFGWMHIVFQNWVAIAMTIVGGGLFAHTYERSRSAAAVWLEHGLWGCAVFTIGLGAYFYGGAVRS